MKKIIFITAAASIISMSSAFAKTEGNYGSVAVLYNRIELGQLTSTSNTTKTTNSAGMGLGYKHAFNFDGIFVAPGVFGERTNIKSSINDVDEVNLKYRYGFRADVGYDIEDDLAVYLTGGLAFMNTKTVTQEGTISHRTKSAPFYGVGISHEYSKKTSFFLEYQTQTYSLAAAGESNRIKVDNNIVKVGMSYKF